MRLPSPVAAAFAAVVAFPALARAQDAPPVPDPAAMAAEARSVQEGAGAGREAAGRRGVGWRRAAGFVGGLPLGLFAPAAGLEREPSLVLGSVAGIAVLTTMASSGGVRPPSELTAAAARRGPAYACAFAAAYGETLRERRRLAAFGGTLVGTITGAVALLALLGAMGGT